MPRRKPPATTVEGRENQLIAYAIDLAEKQLLDGSAPPSVVTHFLKLGSTKERLEKEKLAEENKLLRAKTESIQSSKELAALYEEAMEAMSRYERASDEELF